MGLDLTDAGLAVAALVLGLGLLAEGVPALFSPSLVFSVIFDLLTRCGKSGLDGSGPAAFNRIRPG